MGIQVRVGHALGQRLVDLPDRTVDNPLIVGRSSSADVQVPSVSIAPRHCALFIHEGHWAVQDMRSPTGTFVNGELATEPTFLQIGDVITIGNEASAPRIEVDPAAAAEGRHGYAGTVPVGATAAVAGIAAQGYGAPAGYAPTSYAPAPAAGYPGGYAAPAPGNAGQWAAGGAHDADHHDQTGWGDATEAYAPSGAVSSARRSRARQQQSNSTAIVIGVVAAVLVIGGAIYLVYQKKNQPPKVVVRQLPVADDPPAARANPSTTPAARRVTPPTGGNPTGPVAVAPQPPPNGSTGNPATPAVRPQPPEPPEVTPVKPEPPKPPTPPTGNGGNTARPPVTPPKAGGNDEQMDPVDPDMKTTKPPTTPKAPSTPETPAVVGTGWDAMQDLRHDPTNPALAIFRFEDFRRNNPGKHDADLDKFVDEKFDVIWWERVAMLFKKRDALEAEMAKIKQEVIDVNDPEFKKGLLEKYKKAEKDRDQSVKILRDEMKYDGDQPPNVSDKAQLAALAGKRNDVYYKEWKRRTLHSIKNNHGKLPWEGEL